MKQLVIYITRVKKYFYETLFTVKILEHAVVLLNEIDFYELSKYIYNN